MRQSWSWRGRRGNVHSQATDLWTGVLVVTGLVGVAALFVQLRGRRVVATPGIGIDISDPTLRVRLRSGRSDDLERFTAINDEVTITNMGWRAEDALVHTRSSSVQDAYALGTMLVVADSSTDVVVGFVSLSAQSDGGSHLRSRMCVASGRPRYGARAGSGCARRPACRPTRVCHASNRDGRDQSSDATIRGGGRSELRRRGVAHPSERRGGPRPAV
jgi:hypothetical protein